MCGQDAGDGALRLLSEYGFEADKLERSLQSVALMDRLEPYESVDDTDLDAFLRHQVINRCSCLESCSLTYFTRAEKLKSEVETVFVCALFLVFLNFLRSHIDRGEGRNAYPWRVGGKP